MAGIGALWALGFLVWGLRARKRRQPTGAFIRSLILSAVGLFACLIFYTGYVLSRQAHETTQGLRSYSNLHDLSVSLLQYTQDHNNHLPPANTWATDIEPYVDKAYGSEAFHAPGANSAYSYAFNAALGGLSLNSIARPADTVVLFEADAKTLNATGSAADFVTTRRMEGGYCAFVDGHVRAIKSAASVNWKP
jgi:prepilin-type processing-associated H-X9-DG protein